MVEIVTIATCSEYNAYKVFNQIDRIILEQGEQHQPSL